MTIIHPSPHNIVRNIFTQTADGTVANTTASTTLIGAGVGVTTFPVNFFVAGKTLKISGAGYHSSTANLTIDDNQVYTIL